MVRISCQNCGTEIETYPSKLPRQKYCSRKCYAESLSKNNTGEKHPMYGKHHTAESKEKMSRSMRASAKTGKENPHWTGFFYNRGYRMVNILTLPPEEQTEFAPMATMTDRQYIPEHRVVMARKLGRCLLPSEVVHHINGVKDDNRPGNLELHEASDHKKEHWRILKELKRLRRENELLRAELSKYQSQQSPQAG